VEQVLDESRLSIQIGSMAIAAIFLLGAMLAGYWYIGWAPVIIVGGSGSAAFILWSLTYLRRPLTPAIVLPAFLLTVAGLQVHLMEEYLTGFAPAMSRLYNISWSVNSFLMIFVFIGPVLYTLTALGLFKRIPLAAFLCASSSLVQASRSLHTSFSRSSSRTCSQQLLHQFRPSSGAANSCKLAKFLVSRDRTLLFSRNVHSNPAHDPWHLRYPQTTYRGAYSMKRHREYWGPHPAIARKHQRWRSCHKSRS
jgi:hypothetical protein